MKNTISRNKIIAALLAVVMCMSITCIQAFAANTGVAGDGTSTSTSISTYDYQRLVNKGSWCYTGGNANANSKKCNEYLESIKECDQVMFTSGSRESAESTGIIGSVIKTNGKAQTPAVTTNEKYSKNTVLNNGVFTTITDTVKWVLKDGVLTISGTGKTVHFPLTSWSLSPFAFNPHIKTIVVEDGVTVGDSLFAFLPNVTSITYPAGDHSGTAYEFFGTTSIKTFTVGGYKMPIENYNHNSNEAYAVDVPSQRVKTIAENYKWDTIAMSDVIAIINGEAIEPEVETKPETTTPVEDKTEQNTETTQENTVADTIGNKTVSEWAQNTVAIAINAGLVPETGLGNDYTKAITRAQFCSLAVALYENNTKTTITANASFKDTDDINVLKMATIGVVNGYGGGVFGPDDLITREQAATMLYRLREAIVKSILEQYDKTYTEDTSYLERKLTFTDTPSSWALNGIKYCNAYGIMNGYSTTTFGVKDNYSIEQSIVTMLRAQCSPYDVINAN